MPCVQNIAAARSDVQLGKTKREIIICGAFLAIPARLGTRDVRKIQKTRARLRKKATRSSMITYSVIKPLGASNRRSCTGRQTQFASPYNGEGGSLKRDLKAGSVCMSVCLCICSVQHCDVT